MATQGGKNAGRRPAGPNMGSLLNLERPLPLAAKYANAIGKSVAGFTVTYTQLGMKVEAACLLDKDGKAINDPAKPELVAIPEWERRKALHNQPSEAEKKSAMVRKFELRLNKECKTPPASGSDADIQAWLGTLAWYERKALLMSQKDFSKSFPDGFRPPQ
jgi:hypothetical protein